MNGKNPHTEAEKIAVDNLRQSNTPENRQAFQDAHRKVAEYEMGDIRDRLHRHYRKQARAADSPQVDLETPGDYRNKIQGGE